MATAGPSGLQSRPKRTKEEMFAHRMKTNEKIKAHYAVRVNKFHFKDVTRPTERHHEAIKRHFRDFAEFTQRRLDNGESELQPEVAEIVEDTTLPSLGAC